MKFSGEFNFQSEESSNLRITLNVPDEEKVEYFEVEDPNGQNKIFSSFEDGMVYFKFSGILPSGIWKYSVKLYEDTIIHQDDAITMDVISNKYDSEVTVNSKVFTNIGNSFQADEKHNTIVFAQIMMNGLPVLNADAAVQIFIPTQKTNVSKYSIIPLHDNGLGYPDITSALEPTGLLYVKTDCNCYG